MKRIIIMGSPRSAGRSAHLAETLFEAHIDERPEDELFLVPISEIEVGPCIACDACREPMGVILRGPDGDEARVLRHRCVFDDDMQTLYDLLDDADELTVVAPVFFSGAPSSLKALLDRLQPYYWAMQAEKNHVGEGREGSFGNAKRPAELHVIGEGDDPHGYNALVSEVRSALAVAGFRLERVFDWVGKIDRDGGILADAEEVFPVKPGASAPGVLDAPGSPDAPDAPAVPGAPSGISHASSSPRGAARPKLDLSSGTQPSAKPAKPAAKGQANAKPKPKPAKPAAKGQANAKPAKPAAKGQANAKSKPKPAKGKKATRRG